MTSRKRTWRLFIKCKPGPRGGASQYNNAGARRAAWAALEVASTSEPKGEEAPLPYAEELALLVHHMAAEEGVAVPPPTPPAAPTPAAPPLPA